jgi:hypothetical protein
MLGGVHTISLEYAPTALLALAQAPRIVGRPGVLSAIGWVVNALAIVLLVFALVR